MFYVVQLPWWVKLFNPGGPVEGDPEQILQYGTLMRQALARYMNDDMTVDFVRSVIAENGLTGLLPEIPWQNRSERSGRVAAYGRIVEAALGGAAMALMAAHARQPLEMQHRTELVRDLARRDCHGAACARAADALRGGRKDGACLAAARPALALTGQRIV
jgi:hypothetical protein